MNNELWEQAPQSILIITQNQKVQTPLPANKYAESPKKPETHTDPNEQYITKNPNQKYLRDHLYLLPSHHGIQTVDCFQLQLQVARSHMIASAQLALFGG